MDIWKVLDIDRTTDIRLIKGAYARQARQYHPEEYPEQFRLLQRAYKAALQYAKGSQPRPATDAGRERVLPSPGLAQTIPAGPLQESETTATDTGREQILPSPGFAQTTSAGPPQEPQPLAIDADREQDYDFSEIDSGGEKALFFSQFRLIVYNPCLINNPLAWSLFLNRPQSEKLFRAPAFREEFVEALSSLRGFRRETILQFERYLQRYHRAEDKLPPGRRETEHPRFLKQKRPYMRLTAFAGDTFRGKEGMAFQNTIMARFRRQQRMIDLGRRRDVADYMQVYFDFAICNEEKLRGLYEKRIYARLQSAGLCLFVLLLSFSVIFGGSALQGKAEKRAEDTYREEIYAQQEEQAPLIRQKAGKEIERVLEEYRQSGE